MAAHSCSKLCIALIIALTFPLVGRAEPRQANCTNAARYRQALALLHRAEQAAKDGAFTRSRRVANDGVKVLGEAYWREDKPFNDDTDLGLGFAVEMARKGDARGAAARTRGVLADRLGLYRQYFGDPTGGCP